MKLLQSISFTIFVNLIIWVSAATDDATVNVVAAAAPRPLPSALVQNSLRCLIDSISLTSEAQLDALAQSLNSLVDSLQLTTCTKAEIPPASAIPVVAVLDCILQAIQDNTVTNMDATAIRLLVQSLSPLSSTMPCVMSRLMALARYIRSSCPQISEVACSNFNTGVIDIVFCLAELVIDGVFDVVQALIRLLIGTIEKTTCSFKLV